MDVHISIYINNEEDQCMESFASHLCNNTYNGIMYLRKTICKLYDDYKYVENLLQNVENLMQLDDNILCITLIGINIVLIDIPIITRCYSKIWFIWSVLCNPQDINEFISKLLTLQNQISICQIFVHNIYDILNNIMMEII